MNSDNKKSKLKYVVANNHIVFSDQILSLSDWVDLTQILRELCSKYDNIVFDVSPDMFCFMSMFMHQMVHCIDDKETHFIIKSDSDFADFCKDVLCGVYDLKRCNYVTFNTAYTVKYKGHSS